MTEQSWKNDLEKFRSGHLAPEERARLEQELRRRAGPELEQEGKRLAEQLRGDLGAALRQQESPAFEELEAYVDGALDEADREAFESRLADDPLLCQEVDDLRALRSQLAAEGAAPGRVLAFRRPALIWTGLLAAAALIFAISRLDPPGEVGPSPQLAQVSPLPSQAPERLRLRDGDGQIVLRADGSLDARAVAPDLRPRLLEALADGRLALPKSLERLQGRTGVLMGSEATATGLAALAPVGTCVRDPRPAFRWSAQPHAQTYVVSVYDEQLEKQAGSGELRSTEWRPARPLARGRTYLWQVTALTPQGQVVAPAPPLPQAKLRVLSGEEAAALERQLPGAAGSRLAEGVLFASFGLLDDAAQRFQALVAENPDSPEVARLLAEVRDRSR